MTRTHKNLKCSECYHWSRDDMKCLKKDMATPVDGFECSQLIECFEDIPDYESQIKGDNNR
mgnify:CR=1 FL=1